MKRILLFITLLIIAGCTQSYEDVATISTSEEFYATIEGSDTDTRTYVDGNITTRWHADDRLTIFKKETYNREYKFKGKTGDNSGGFTQVSVDDDFYSSEQLDKNYAVYPHSNDNCFNKQTESFELIMPTEQTYAENTFGRGANTMVAVSETGQLLFKNVGSFLRVRLWGEDTAVSSITITSNGDEVIAGEAIVKPTMGGDPTCVMTGSAKSITLNCPTPVTISDSESTPTDFWIVLPPVIFEDGFTVTVKNTADEVQTFNKNEKFTFGRNLYYNFKREVTLGEPIDPSAQIPNNEIWYTTSDGNYVNFNPSGSDGWGANCNKNTYTDGKGVITFDGDVTAIPNGIMWGSGVERITSITIPNTVKSIGSNAFDGCTNLTSFVIPEGVTNIDNGAFACCSKLTSVTIPESVTSIGEGAFEHCENIEKFNGKFVTDNVLIVNNTLIAFPPKSSVTSYIIPNGVTKIGVHAFNYCYNLQNITINGVTAIGHEAFWYCNNVSSVTLPVSLTEIGDRPFYGCDGIKAFYGKFATQDFDALIKDNKLIAYAKSCGASSYEIPDGVTEIGGDVFSHCSDLTSITIPASVTTIQAWAFNSCSGLTTVNCLGNTPPTYVPADMDIPSNYYMFYIDAGADKYGNIEHIYVPEGAVEAYKTADYWDKYAEYIEGYNFTE